jgi:hypothetical protein
MESSVHHIQFTGGIVNRQPISGNIRAHVQPQSRADSGQSELVNEA